MTPLPVLANWDATRKALHQALQPLRDSRIITVGRLPNFLHLALLPSRSGIVTGPLAWGGDLKLDFGKSHIVYLKQDEEVFSIPLADHTQSSLFNKVFAEFRDLGHELTPRQDGVTENEPLAPDVEHGAAYAEVLWRMHTALARVKASFYGNQTPSVVWPHGFDLSTIWFLDKPDEEAPHINYGFSPGTPDIDQPYIYFYAYPLPTGLREKMPAEVSWITTWSTPGGYIRYDRFQSESDPEAFVEQLLSEIHRIASAMLADPV